MMTNIIGTKGIEWKLNDQAKATTYNGEELTQAVQQVIDVDDTDRNQVLAEHMGADALMALAELYGPEPIQRVQGIALMDGRPIMLGDCPCKGADCRSAWGATWVARDLDMAGHRGSLKAQPCSSMKATRFDPSTGKMHYPVPLGMNPADWYRYERAHWGDANKKDLAEFMNASVASGEGKKIGDWVVDE